jgi:phosphoserine phosphatase
MPTIIQHNLDEQIALKISSDFQVLSTHIRHQTNLDLNILREKYSVDFNLLPHNMGDIRLFVSDMDSTLINIECIDEIADFANLKPQVAHITEQAMQGKIDFTDSLLQRVALLEGLNTDVLNKVYTQRLALNLGARELVDFFHKMQIKSAVVSGGFDYFTQRLQQDIGLDYARANTLKTTRKHLTGKLSGLIIDATAKADFVRELCKLNQITPKQVLVAGDGANDLEMMKISGLSVAYHAKTGVQKSASVVISHGGLDKIIDFFG